MRRGVACLFIILLTVACGGQDAVQQMGLEEYAEERISCLESYRPGYQQDTWGEIVERAIEDRRRLNSVEPAGKWNIRLGRQHHYDSMALVDTILTLGTSEEVSPDQAVEELQYYYWQFARALMRWRDSRPEAIRQECGY